MNEYPACKPSNNQVVIAYLSDGGGMLCQYRRVLTWTGWKYKFVNLRSKGLWADNVVGWNRIPRREETLE